MKILNALEHKAAMLAIGKLDAYEIQATIRSLYDEGYYSDDFLDALDAGLHPRMEEVLPSLLAAFIDQDVSVPSKDTAVWQLIAHYLIEISTGVADPLKNLLKLMDKVVSNFDFESITTKYLGDSHGIARLIGLYWEYDEKISERGAYYGGVKIVDLWPSIKAQVIEESNLWVAKYVRSDGVLNTFE